MLHFYSGLYPEGILQMDLFIYNSLEFKHFIQGKIVKNVFFVFSELWSDKNEIPSVKTFD